MHIGIDNDPLNDDDICSMGKQTWEEIMNDESTENPFFTFHEYMSTMAKLNKGFSFQFLQDTTGRYTGCIWMTATMRSDFERFGSYICLDGMQKIINMLAWPYMAMTLYNELNSICVACEAIICPERQDGYRAMIDFVVGQTKKKRKDVMRRGKLISPQ